MPRQNITAIQKLEELLDKSTRTEQGCLIPHLKPNAKGYVPIQVGGRYAKKERAHRFVYNLLVGEIPTEMMVLHKCDMRNCINPEHLFLGTAKDNTQDMMQKGRHKYITHRKISEVELQYMRDCIAQGHNKFAIAKSLGVHYETVRAYLKGEKNV